MRHLKLPDLGKRRLIWKAFDYSLSEAALTSPAVSSATLSGMTPISGAAGRLFVSVDGFVERPADAAHAESRQQAREHPDHRKRVHGVQAPLPQLVMRERRLAHDLDGTERAPAIFCRIPPIAPTFPLTSIVPVPATCAPAFSCTAVVKGVGTRFAVTQLDASGRVHYTAH